MANGKFGAKEVLDAVLYDMATGKPVIRFDTLKTSEIAVTTEKVYARGGRGNSKLLTWEVNKEATMKIEDALLSPKSLELVSGLARKTGTKSIQMCQKTEWDVVDGIAKDKGGSHLLTCSSDGAINLAFKPNEEVANILVYLADDDCGTPVDMTGATLSEKVLTLGSGGIAAAGGKRVIVYYSYMSSDTAETYVIDSENFSGTYKLVGDTVVRNASTGKDESFQIVIPSLKWSSGLTLSFAAEGDPSVQTFECEVQREADSPVMIEMIKY
ncbi:hypothetical protein [Qiania dongpingensis]|uniref:Uncharacterized protein n=1 Tax=Qiania dongpingensis TaxID=2763669 RepID=A0A7G9G5J4_9FIRM|nr:hypothetical protein [Qiania dongpingensis]QNM06076.1 hypothetical protein H9Q78_02625 [Qiania dongpingensis]